jgi:Cu2+-exporting ATPase
MSLIKETYPVEEMSCAVCAQSVESMLSSVWGVKSANVNFASASVLVEFDEKYVSSQDLKNAVESIGYKLIINQSVN